MSKLWEKRKSELLTDPAFDTRVLANALVAYSQAMGHFRSEGGRKHALTGRFVRLAKWAALPAAAAILFLLVDPFGLSGVAWGKIIERIEKAPTLFSHTYVYWQKEGAESQRAIIQEIRAHVSREYGARFDMLTLGKENGRLYISPDGKTGTTIDYVNGKIQYHVDPDPDNRPLLSNPKFEVERFLSKPYKKIGKSVIEGRTVEGVEAKIDKRVQGAEKKAGDIISDRLWVDVAAGLPVRRESTRKLFGNMNMVSISDYQWNVPLDPSIFRIPEAPFAPQKK